MGVTVMRLSVVACCLSLGWVGLSLANDANASMRKTTDIPAEELGSALQTLAKDYDFQVLYRTEIVKDLRTDGAVGTLTSDEALGKVLRGTGLTYKYLDEKTVTIISRQSLGGADSPPTDLSPADPAKEGGKKSSQDFRLAQVDQGKGAGLASVTEQGSTSAANSATPSGGLQEIVVTANKRAENVETVPASVSVLTGAAIEELHATQLSEYAGYVP